jgi:putative phosphoribosyl transferase
MRMSQHKSVVGPVEIALGPVRLEGVLTLPEDARGVVVFAHGSGSSRLSPRNRFVARVLEEGRIGTLLMDLLTPQEEQADAVDGSLRFDIDLLAQRLIGATTWLANTAEARDLWLAYFGASTGAGAALVAAAARPERIRALLSRGGRPDLAGSALERVLAPTLLIVGGNDLPVIDLNWEAFRQLRCVKRMEIVPGAGHLFEEPGALDIVAELARDWFKRHLGPRTDEE